MKNFYLPNAENSRDFVILGPESGFWAMVFTAAALAVAAAVLIIKAIKKKK